MPPQWKGASGRWRRTTLARPIGSGTEEEGDGQGGAPMRDCVRMVHFVRNALAHVPELSLDEFAEEWTANDALPSGRWLLADHYWLALDTGDRP